MSDELDSAENIVLADKILSKYSICNACLGRMFAKIGQDMSNSNRGLILRQQVKGKPDIKQECWLCEGIIDEIDHFTDLIISSLKNYEFETFLLGCIIDDEIQQKEHDIQACFPTSYNESIKNELNREIGKKLEEKLQKTVDFENPTIMAILDTSYDVVDLQIKSLYLYGRYKKLVRGIPQTKWFCRICRGKGCKRCNYKGKLYDDSVEELIAEKILKKTKGTDESFHGCGREDIDARMLGRGRPFIIEIKNPKVREIEMSDLSKSINKYANKKVEITNLRYSNNEEVARIKSAEFKKIYRVKIIGEKLINIEKLKKAARTLQGTTISQYTPSRVARRRANMIREKKIYACNVDSIDGNIAILTIESESGTYIKELVSGDNGNTYPNISELIGIPCSVKELDVMEIKGE
jgi:tRNA pseudouridine synthase 10